MGGGVGRGGVGWMEGLEGVVGWVEGLEGVVGWVEGLVGVGWDGWRGW